MDQAMQSDTWHDVDEETGNFVEAVENHRIPPHSYGDGVISKGETEGADEETLGLGENPYTEKDHEVDEIAEIGQKVVITDFTIGEIPDRHKV